MAIGISPTVDFAFKLLLGTPDACWKDGFWREIKALELHGESESARQQRSVIAADIFWLPIKRSKFRNSTK